MKRLSSLVIVVTFLSLMDSWSATFPGFVGFGSVENAENQYGAPNSKNMDIYVYQVSPGGPIYVKSSFVASRLSFSSKEEVDAFFRTQLKSVAAGALTNSLVDKSRPFAIYADTTRAITGIGAVIYLYNTNQFSLVKSSDGSYALPDFSSLKLRLNEEMLIEVDRLEWARIEQSYNPATCSETGMVYVEDSRFSERRWIFPATPSTPGYIKIPTKVATSGVTGSTLFKASLVTREASGHDFRIFGPSGTRVPETPIIIQNDNLAYEGFVGFTIKGSDTGRVLQVQFRESLSDPWVDIGDPIVVPRNGYPPMRYSAETQSLTGFYRIRTLNVVPY